MKRPQPKKKNMNVSLKRDKFGYRQRLSYQETILDKEPVFPKPLEYDDIDKSMFEFVDKTLDMVIDGKLVPTFTLFSNQRFSEYSQMWEHSDEQGNLYLNFKTINREKNPSFGGNQGPLWKIPGNRRYTILRRKVLDDNGIENYEIYSMRQPYTVDLTYNITFIGTMLEKVNEFNEKVNDLFAARQCYIRPNGHFIPMVIDEISDETSYAIEERKFYVQTVTIKVMAYIIHKSDFKVRKYNGRTNLLMDGYDTKKKVSVDIEDYEDSPYKNKTMGVTMTFPQYSFETEFEFDCNMKVEEIIMENVDTVRLMVNGTLYYIEKGFTLHPEDDVRIRITKEDDEDDSMLKFVGYDPTTLVDTKTVPEFVKDTQIGHEEIIVEN